MLDEVQTILVIDDHPLMRRGILQLIAMEDSLRRVGEAGDGQHGLELACQLRPDLILLDLNTRGLSGLDTLKAIKAAGLDARVIILTVSDSEDDVVSALRAGADGYLLKDMEPEDVLHSLKIAAQGRMALGERVAEILADSLRHESHQPQSADSAGLTEREQKILSLIAVGYSNKLIARELKITEGTVKVHVKHLLSKLNLDSRVEAAVWAVKNRSRNK